MAEKDKKENAMFDDAPEADAKAKADEAKAETKADAKDKAKAEKKKTYPVLKFKSSGWCEALGRSYRQGTYKPKDQKEYDALKEFATNVVVD